MAVAPLTKKETQVGYALTGLTAIAYLVIWYPVIIGKVHSNSHSFFTNPLVAITEGLVLMALTAIMIWRRRRRFAGAFAMLVGLGAGWGTLVLLAFPLLAFGVFVGFKIDRADVERRRMARQAKREGRSPSTQQTASVGNTRIRPQASKRYTPPKRRSGRRRRD
ncbi:MAG: hypothetical protein ACYDHP_10795 [Ferrimicrobium sp.]